MTDSDLPDITEFRTFVITAVFMLLFGGMIGAGFYVTFAGLSIPPDKGVAVIVILFITGFTFAYVMHRIKERLVTG